MWRSGVGGCRAAPPVLLLLLLWLQLCLFAASSSTFLSDGIFISHSSSTSRNLLQTKKACPVNFEFLNYTIITSQCKGPDYPPKLCCGAFKEFACPYVDVINDLSTDCASTMFSYINIYGKYPPGLFASECREGKQGLACPAQSPSMSENVGGTYIARDSSLLLMLSSGIMVMLFLLF